MKVIDVDAYLKKVCTYNETGCGSCKLQTKCPADEPTVDAVPVEFIKGRLKDLRKILMDIDSDDVDEIWDLRTKIETLTELLDMWAERKDDGKERTV